jgi:hypothetical protein
MKILQFIKRSFGIPRLLRLISPGFSHCQKCGLPWNFCNPKAVYYSDHSGTIATCDYCWDNSTLLDVKCCYAAVYTKQKISLYGTEYTMDHTCEQLLDCVEKEYNRTHLNN